MLNLLSVLLCRLLLHLLHLGASTVHGRWKPPDNATLTFRLLLLGYLVLPVCSLKQLQALDCVSIAGNRYMRIDTSIDCSSRGFQTFLVLDSLFITLYLATPIVWFVLLFRARKRLIPPSVAVAALAGEKMHC